MRDLMLGRTVITRGYSTQCASISTLQNLEKLTKNGQTPFAPREVYKKTPFGKRFMDIEVSQNGTVLGGIETKVGSSRYTPLQQLKDLWLKHEEGYIVNVEKP